MPSYVRIGRGAPQLAGTDHNSKLRAFLDLTTKTTDWLSGVQATKSPSVSANWRGAPPVPGATMTASTDPVQRRKLMRVPSGDQAAPESTPASGVNRRGAPPLTDVT